MGDGSDINDIVRRVCKVADEARVAMDGGNLQHSMEVLHSEAHKFQGRHVADILGSTSFVDLVNAARMLNERPFTGFGVVHVLQEASFKVRGAAERQVFLEVASESLSILQQSYGHVSPKPLAHVIRAVSANALIAGRCRQVVRPLESARLSFDVSSTCLTPAHPELLKIYLFLRLYKRARRLLQTPVLEVDPTRTGVVAEDVQLYLLYAGQVYMAYEHWDRAAEMLDLCVSVPASVLTGVAQSAWQRRMLVGLCLSGRSSVLPSAVSGSIRTSMERTAQSGPYADIVRAFDSPEMNATIDRAEEALRANGDWGLAQQVRAAARRRAVMGLAHTFVALPLADVAHRAGLDDVLQAEHELRRIARDPSAATKVSIDAVAGTARFGGAAADLDPTELHRRIELAQALTNAAIDSERQAVTDPAVLAAKSSRHHSTITGGFEDIQFSMDD